MMPSALCEITILTKITKISSQDELTKESFAIVEPVKSLKKNPAVMSFC